LLLLNHALAHHLVHRGFSEARGNLFSVPITIPIIWDEVLVRFDACKIFINRGKGAKDRYILLPANFRLVLKSHLHAAPRNRYLFETRRFGPFTTRRIQQIVQGYREMADIMQPLHPHLFRH
jgi:site-specific recombinase XerD